MKTLVEGSSLEWANVHYRLQLVLGTPAALPLKIYKFNHFESEYNQLKHRYHNKTIINAHINLSELDEASQRKLYERKIKMSDVRIQAGHLNIHVDSKEMKKSSLVLMKVAVGDSYSIHALPKNQKPPNVPDRYDSLYECSNEKENIYKHNYILRQPDQYVLEYEIFYTLEKSREYNVRDVNCYKCIKKSATIYCKQEEAFFCSECNHNHHKDGLLYSHAREQLTKYNTIQLCQEANHNKRLEIYCQTCMKLMCVECMMNGWHSRKQFSNHETRSLKKYCESKLRENEETSRQKRGELEDALKQLEEIIKDVDNHALNLQSRIKEIYESILRDLKDNTKNKLDKLLIAKIQLKRKYDELVWADSFIKYQQHLLKPPLYLDAQIQYEKIKQEIIDGPLPNLPKIAVEELELDGGIRLVESGSDKRLYSEYSSSKYNDNRDSRYKSPSQSEKKSLNSKFANNKSSLKSVLNPPNDSAKPPIKPFKPGHSLQIQVPTQKQKSTPPHSISQSRSLTPTAPLLQKSLKNANLTFLKFN